MTASYRCYRNHGPGLPINEGFRVETLAADPSCGGQVSRPLTMKKDGIQTRNRKLSSKSKKKKNGFGLGDVIKPLASAAAFSGFAAVSGAAGGNALSQGNANMYSMYNMYNSVAGMHHPTHAHPHPAHHSSQVMNAGGFMSGPGNHMAMPGHHHSHQVAVAASMGMAGLSSASSPLSFGSSPAGLGLASTNNMWASLEEVFSRGANGTTARNKGNTSGFNYIVSIQAPDERSCFEIKVSHSARFNELLIAHGAEQLAVMKMSMIDAEPGTRIDCRRWALGVLLKQTSENESEAAGSRAFAVPDSGTENARMLYFSLPGREGGRITGQKTADKRNYTLRQVICPSSGAWPAQG
ncbi:unnamed protein product [Notodromas monacha]|uniref:Uncharacterized protein n=1 Tax=Notodromas monacha TaxID=399045 RepID=A0A7R9BDI7_9CRUS|nr:unnamed protein product [Notodromas monacha]CAG0913342.1 unnamed protein product [Notodromas monacha]